MLIFLTFSFSFDHNPFTYAYNLKLEARNKFQSQNILESGSAENNQDLIYIYMLYLSVYSLKTLISIGIVVTLLVGITLLYVIVYAFLISSVTAQILPDFRNGFIAAFMIASLMMILSSLSGIYGLIRKRNKFVIGYSVTMLIYFVVFIVLAAFMIKYPTYLKTECVDQDATMSSIRFAIEAANETLGKTCECYFDNMRDYNEKDQRLLKQMGFTNLSNSERALPVNAETCQEWDNQTYESTATIVFLEYVFNCSGWCDVQPEYNLYYLFTDVNRGKPKKTCLQSLLQFFNKFGSIMLISCLVVGSILFLILLTILCLCCHPDRGQQYDAMKFFKSTLMVQLNEEQQKQKSQIISTCS